MIYTTLAKFQLNVCYLEIIQRETDCVTILFSADFVGETKSMLDQILKQSMI